MKHYFYQIFLVILTSFMIACSDDDSIIYPDDTTYHEVDSLVGRIAYDSNHGNWVVYPEIAGYSPVPVGDHLPIMIIEGFKESYKVFKDNIVLIRGKYKKLYTVVRNANLGDEDVYYSVQIDTIELFDRVRTRSAGINEIDEDYCGTTSSSSPEWTEWSLMKKAKAYSPYYTYDYEFRTFLHVVRYSDGSNPLNTTKEQIAQEMIAALNSYYSESGITFKNIGSEYIDSDNWNKISAKNARNIFYHYSNSNAIDIFVFSGADNLGNLAGEAKDIPSTALLVNRDYYKKTTIAHEVGHCLGLFHTHHGTFSGESNNATPELVDGSNSAIAGDYVVDTPADPNAWLYGMYSGNGKDANGDLYNPDPRNIMSYSHAYNQNLFSSLQIDRIHKKISADNGLKQASTFTRRVIDGPTFISTQGTYSISVPNNYSVSWNVKCDTYSSYSGGVSSTTYHEYTGKSITLTNLNDSKSKKYTLIASFTTPKGIVRAIEKTVFYISLSPQNGNWRWSAELGTNSVKAGEISMTSSNVIKVYRGGILNLSYNDATGASSDIYDDFVFQVMSTPSFMTKANGSNSHFNCSSNISAGTYNAAFQLMVKNSTKLVAVSIQVLDPSGVNVTYPDSIKIESMAEKVAYKE